jgi:hypothetical protein
MYKEAFIATITGVTKDARVQHCAKKGKPKENGVSVTK